MVRTVHYDRAYIKPKIVPTEIEQIAMFGNNSRHIVPAYGGIVKPLINILSHVGNDSR